MRKKYNVVILSLILIFSFTAIDGTAKHGEQDKQNRITCEVVRVVDGDTIVANVNGKEKKVRFIGIDTPESVHPDSNKNTEEGKLASEYTKQLLEGSHITLGFDVQQTDQYGRLLAYAFLEDGTFVNEKLILDGYAKIATYPPNVKYVEVFKEAIKLAKNSSNIRSTYGK